MKENELAKRAVACKGWRWMPGMLTESGYRVCDNNCTWPHLQKGDTLRSGLHFPDLTDPATLGCLLALVREARQESTWLPTCLDAENEAWVAELPSRNRQTRHESYAAVLVAALEAAS
jgi:hypothetical protein